MIINRGSTVANANSQITEKLFTAAFYVAGERVAANSTTGNSSISGICVNENPFVISLSFSEKRGPEFGGKLGG
jgi:hypothetical protein